MAIKFGDIKYFELLELERKLKGRSYDKLDLLCLDKLRNEVDTKIKQIHYVEKLKNDCSDCDGTGIIDNSYMACLSCNGTGKR